MVSQNATSFFFARNNQTPYICAQEINRSLNLIYGRRKMKKRFYSTALLLALLATSCGDANQKTSALPQINVSTSHPEKEICLQDVAEVGYIPLDSKDDILFGGHVRSFSDKGIVILDDQNKRLIFFDKQGRFQNVINRKGQGPEEYSMMFNALVDWDKEEVFVFDSSSKIVVYSLEGTFKRRLSFDSHLGQHDAYICSDSQLISYQNGGWSKDGKLIPYQPVVLLSKEDGKMDSLSYRKEHNFPTFIGGKEMNIRISWPSLAKLNGDVYVNDLSADTIYHLDARTWALQPMMTRTPSVTLDDLNGFLMDLYGITPQYYFLHFRARQASMDSHFVMVDEKSKNAVYDRKNGKIYHPKFTNKDYPSMEKIHMEFCEEIDNCATVQLEAFELLEALEAGELSGELKTIAEGLKEDDNPVLMVVKFKGS